jgi:hypothetical protein
MSQPHRGGGSADRAVLAAGELAAGEVTSSGFPAERRTHCASLGHRRSSRVTSIARMAGRWRGSPTTRWSRPWRGLVRSARDPRSQDECKNTRNWMERREHGSLPGSTSSTAMAPPCNGKAHPGLTVGKVRAKACARDGGGSGGAGGRRNRTERAAYGGESSRSACCCGRERVREHGGKQGTEEM